MDNTINDLVALARREISRNARNTALLTVVNIYWIDLSERQRLKVAPTTEILSTKVDISTHYYMIDQLTKNTTIVSNAKAFKIYDGLVNGEDGRINSWLRRIERKYDKYISAVQKCNKIGIERANELFTESVDVSYLGGQKSEQYNLFIKELERLNMQRLRHDQEITVTMISSSIQ
ncbi:MAG: hypothetical protein ABR981_04815 [Candidatus Micrarchaeaceae archaeon]